MPTEAASRILAAARRQDSTGEELQDLVRRYLETARAAPEGAVHDSMRILTEGFGVSDPFRGAYLANACGALVEHGADPLIIAGPLLDRVRRLMDVAASFHSACIAEMPSDEQLEEDEVDRDEAFDEVRARLADRMPEGARAWEALDPFLAPALAVLTRSPASCRDARSLLPQTEPLSEYNEAAFWLNKIARVLYDEPVIVIEPLTRLGFAGTMSGVVDNFQLHILLMDVFPQRGFFKSRRVAREVVECASGLGPQQLDTSVRGAWNLYSWQAVVAGGELPPASDTSNHEHWIWGEGVPEDIPRFRDHRVILLGPPSYERSFGCGRMFDGLRAAVVVGELLSKQQVADLMARFAAEVAACCA